MKKYSILFLCLIAFLSKNVLAQNPNDSLQTINLLFVGDVMGHNPQIKSAEILKDKVYDYTPCFKYVKPIIQAADFAVGNLEVTLPGKPPYQGYPQFRSPDELATALYYAGFDLLTTANNHSNDAGKEGLINTIKTLDANGFYHTGTFKNKEERALYYPLLVYKNGFKIAFLNYTYGTNGLKSEPPTLVNEIDEDLIQADMKEAEALNPDLIIVLMHWGKEYQLMESEKHEKLAKNIFNWGADLIVGGHPHVVQPIKEYTIKRPDNSLETVVIPYSLGNFISNQKQKNTDGGLIFEVNFQKDQTGKVAMKDHHFIPVWRYIYKDEKGKATYHVVPIAAFENDPKNTLKMTEKNLKAMKKYAKNTRTHLAKFKSSERKISKDALGF